MRKNNDKYPKQMYHPSKEPIAVQSMGEQSKLGPDWSEKYIHRKYPKWMCHWSKKSVIVNSAAEEAALGPGWGDHEDFEPYRQTRRRPEHADVLKWVDEWTVPGLSTDGRNRIKAALLRADADFWRSTEVLGTYGTFMREAFGRIATILLDLRILTEQQLRKEIPELVWDSAISAGWFQRASTVRSNILPYQAGHYFCWYDDTEDWTLFHGKIGEFMAALLDTPHDRKLDKAKSRSSRSRKVDPTVNRLNKQVRELRAAGLTHAEICARLGGQDRPPRASWRNLPWPVAYKRCTRAVTKWLSKASR